MRIYILLIIIGITQAMGMNVYSQTTLINLHLNNATVEDVINGIEEQSEFRFLYNKKIVDVESKVSINARNENITSVLDNLFREADISYAISDRQIVLNRRDVFITLLPAIARQTGKRIYGTVIDERGNPIAGANIIEKSVPNGSSTDVDGNFSLVVEDDAVLQVSYIGYIMQEVRVLFPTVSPLVIKLIEDAQALEEVVVIGYGSVRKSDLTGSVGSIRADNVKGISIRSVDQILQGQTSGLHMVQSSGMPGASSTVRIRGGNSISGGNEPLYVIDGIPVYPGATGSQTDLNPLNSIPTSDIESIEVLKDASSTAIYGSRGANGVIIITTKRGESGRSQVSFETYWGVQNVAGKFDILDAPTFEKLANEALVNSGGNPWYDESIIPQTTDWQALMANENALVQNYQLSISGGNDKTSFLASFNIFNQEGIIKATDMKKFAFRTNIDHAVSSTIKAGINLNLVKVDNDRAGNNVLEKRLTTPPNVPVRENDGSYSFSDNAGVVVFDNPVAVINDRVSKTAQFRTLDNLYVEWDIIKGLKFRSSLGIDMTYTMSDGYNPNTVYNGRLKGGIASKSANSTFMWINENILTYTNHWEKHAFMGMAGYTQQSSVNNAFSAGSYGYQNDILQMNSLGAGTTADAPSSSLTEWALNSYLGRINYTFDSKYLLTASFRADGSSRFGKSNRWGYFPSAALAWRASEESYIKNTGIFSNLKPRISYGVTGNQDGIGVYPSYALLGSTGYQVKGQKVTGYYPSQVANTKLKWETTAQYDAGIDIGFFNNRLNVVIDAYYKKTDDLLLSVKIPSTSGFTSGLKNVGKVENRGVEFAINAVPLKGAFTWNTNFNITFNKNKVINLGELSFIYPSQPADEGSGIHLGRIIQVGEPLGAFYGYVFDGIFSTTDDIASSAQPTAEPGDIRYKDISGAEGVPDGQINDLDRVIIGCAQPDFFGGFGNTFTYKNFELNINTVFSYGNDIYNGTRASMENMQGSSNMFASTVNRWTPQNQNNTMPRMYRSKAVMRVSSQYVEDGSYLRIQNITLGYNVPRRALSFTKHVTSLRLYASLQNVFTFTNYSGNNPEVSRYGSDNLGSGYDNFTYPLSKTVTFGLNINF
ncbi:MAG: TonB-dependent receptor [Tannerella sp.]|jgi:TonB-linked SusC/RagA family outer membrane protein|nr:TonB-dependent receptor [Tannerella sp.]